MASEILDAGAMSAAELWTEIGARGVLPRRPRRATLDEWWEYSERRRLIEIDASTGRAGVTKEGRDELALREAEWRGSSLIDGLKRATTWVVPSGAVVFAAASLGREDAVLAKVLVILVSVLGASLPLFWLGDLALRLLDQPIRRKLLRDAIRFLYGEPMRVGRRALPQASPRRLY